LDDKLKILNENFCGDFTLETDGSIYWEYYEYPFEDEPHDHFWNIYCEVADGIRGMYPNAEIYDSGSDNDTCWFNIKGESL